ncbi:hypothetical protein NDN08_005353 [Rhodosorus marinus]|uniref:Uncharacterized protein n=1 Tax=Rhodosorus marinus TaxID=101924 RepID=A0AAV8V4B4_9RHOD|nr:hypothetical protein NDN08_005353 [Rhodosorus marinus]
MKDFWRKNAQPSCSTFLSSADVARLGEDGEVCVDLSTTPFDRRRRPDLPEVMGSACATLNEDRDQLEVKFQILDGVGGDFVLKRTQGGVYIRKSHIPRSTSRAYKKSVWHTGHVTEATMSFDLTSVRHDCCSKGILLVLRAIVYPKSNPRSRFFLYPAEDDSGTCKRNYRSRVRTCVLDVSCEEDECAAPDVDATTCVRAICPDTTSSVGPVVCDIINQSVDTPCTLFGDSGTWQSDTAGNHCVCEPNNTPAPCILEGVNVEIFPGDRCFFATNPSEMAIRTSANGECECTGDPQAVVCGQSLTGAECLSNSNAPGVFLNIGVNAQGGVECVCTGACEYLTNPVSNPSAVAVGHIGQECSAELAGSDVKPPGVLVDSRLGTCSCQPLDWALDLQCEFEEIDSDGSVSVEEDRVYEGCRIGGNTRGVLIPSNADPAVCDCVPRESCQCPYGQTCQYAGMNPGDSCQTEFGNGFLAQRSDNGGCNCRINCELDSPCDGDCDDYTFGSCEINGVRGFVIPTSEAGVCTCEFCDPGQCGYPDLGCIHEGSSCTDLSGRADVLLRDVETRCTCGCDLRIGSQFLRRSSAGKACGLDLATGVVVTGSSTGSCGCQVQNCTSSTCQGPDCEPFDGVIGETCESETGIIKILPDGSCKCEKICKTINCGDGQEDCTEEDFIAIVGDVCFSSGVGVLEPSSDVDGECDCVSITSTTCVFESGTRLPQAEFLTGVAAGSPGDSCTVSSALGVVTGENSDPFCLCEPLCKETCFPVGCDTSYGVCDPEAPNTVVGARCITSSESHGTYKYVSGSSGFCECVSSG